MCACVCCMGACQMTRTPQTVVAAMELMLSFIRVHLLWCLIDERRYMVSVLLTAYHIKGDTRHDPNHAR